MLFEEVYGSYYQVVAQILAQAVRGELTPKGLTALAAERAFAESALTIPDKLRTGKWPLLKPDLTTPLRHVPTRPMTTLQKRWLKALLLDPRIALFQPSMEGLEEVEPLYRPEMLVYYDRYSDGDPYADPAYIDCGRAILRALREGRRLRVEFQSGKGRARTCICVPHHLEYSAKDDKLRLIALTRRKALTINLSRIGAVEVLGPFAPEERWEPESRRETLVLELTDERDALERVMLHFSHLEKETRRLDGKHYVVTLRYDAQDESELLIRVLSFGPLVRVVAPQRFIDLVRERLDMQQKRCALASMIAPSLWR